MAMMECKLGVTDAKRFPNGTVQLNVSEADQEWLSESKLWISGWEYPLLILKGATGSGEGDLEYVSLGRAILERHGFPVGDTRVNRMDIENHLDVTHENLIIPESLVPEFPIDNNYNLTLAAYKKGLVEAVERLRAGDGTTIVCMEEGTKEKFFFVVDEEDKNFFSGTKVKFTQHGQPLFMCEDLKYRTATQELCRRGRLGVSFAAPDVITRRLTTNKYDLRKGQVAVFRTVRKAGR